MGVEHHSLFTIGIESIFENSVHSSAGSFHHPQNSIYAQNFAFT